MILMIKELREKTGLGVLECRKLLDKYGSVDECLKNVTIRVSNGKRERVTSEGVVESYIHPTNKIGVMLVLRCETDFVAKTDEFSSLSKNLCMHIAAMSPGTLGELLEQKFVKDLSKSIMQVIDETITKLGENVVVEKFERYEV